MRDLFRGYYKPTPEELAEIWKTCTFSFDANILLHIYSYTPETRKSFFEILNGLKERIWIPHQVAYEYQRNRLYVISDQVKAYEDIEEIITKKFLELKNELLKGYKRHPFINTRQIIGDFENSIEEVKSKIKFARSNHPNYLESDQLREALSDLLDGKVGQPYSEEELENMYHSDQFLDYAEKFLGLPVQPEAVQEAREIMLQDSADKRIVVESNYLRSVGYDSSSQVLEIEFQRGEVYQYIDVPPAVYTDLMNAPSHGKYFNANIKEVYPYRK